MSNGPIQQWRSAWKSPASTSAGAAVHARGARIGRAYCGRKTSQFGGEPTCPDCRAALAADQPTKAATRRG